MQALSLALQEGKQVWRPHRCCSSMTAMPRLRNSVESVSSAWVPTSMCTVPSCSSASISCTASRSDGHQTAAGRGKLGRHGCRSSACLMKVCGALMDQSPSTRALLDRALPVHQRTTWGDARLQALPCRHSAMTCLCRSCLSQPGMAMCSAAWAA